MSRKIIKSILSVQILLFKLYNSLQKQKAKQNKRIIKNIRQRNILKLLLKYVFMTKRKVKMVGISQNVFCMFIGQESIKINYHAKK